MENITKIYLVATIKDIQTPTEARQVGNYGMANIFETRVVGYFLTLEEAKKCIKNNWCDIHENYYKYAVIEDVAPGLYRSIESKPLWFRWTKTGYRPIQKPGQISQIFGFTIG